MCHLISIDIDKENFENSKKWYIQNVKDLLVYKDEA